MAREAGKRWESRETSNFYKCSRLWEYPRNPPLGDGMLYMYTKAAIYERSSFLISLNSPACWSGTPLCVMPVRLNFSLEAKRTWANSRLDPAAMRNFLQTRLTIDIWYPHLCLYRCFNWKLDKLSDPVIIYNQTSWTYNQHQTLTNNIPLKTSDIRSKFHQHREISQAKLEK